MTKTGEAESHMVGYFNMCNRKYGQMGGVGERSFMRCAENPHISAKANSQRL